MRILQVYPQYHLFSRGGGVERYIHQLSSHCQGVHAVTVAARTADVNVAVPYRVVAASPRALLREIWAADAVHIHGPRTAYAAFAGLAALMFGKPLFYTVHCFYGAKTHVQRVSKFLWDHTVERLLLARACHVAVLSNAWHDFLKQRRLPVGRAVVVPNGIDIAALQAEDFSPVVLAGAPSLLSVCRLDPVKRVEDMIAALALPGMDQAHLHIVGTGADRARLEAWAVQQGVAARVTWHGFQPDAQIAAMARAADVFILASAEEGMPTTLLEMLARGLPVVASAIMGNLGLSEMLHWPHTYPLGDVQQMVQQIRAVHGATVPDTVVQRLQPFSWPVIAQQWCVLYTDRP